jgi:hypothetical protein
MAAGQPKAGSVLEPARPEMAGSTPRNLSSRSMTPKPDKESWDFDGSMLTSARNGTRRSPMLTHETLLVSGASGLGMTSRVGQGHCYLPADVLGISTAPSQEDRLCPKGRLCQQPAGDSTKESQSRRRQQDPSNGCFAKSSLAPTRSTEVRDGRDASHTRVQPISGQDPSPRKDPRQKGENMPSRCWSKGKGHFIKVPSSEKESEASGSRQDRGHGGAGSRAAGHLTCNQTPAYIRGSGPLD